MKAREEFAVHENLVLPVSSLNLPHVRKTGKLLLMHKIETYGVSYDINECGVYLYIYKWNLVLDS